jgi:osmotically inducible lipoprotein OsmB
MTHRTPLAGILALLLLSFGACSNLSRHEQNTVEGAAIGGVAGAILTGGSAVGTVGGAVVGGVIGDKVEPKRK